jgi:hypothetical protein
MAAYIDQLIMFLAGAYATGVGFGWLASPARGPQAADWERRFTPVLRITGPIMIAIAILLMLAEMFR